jgi:DNA-directed RNA polymerase specialized sigma24 family protein
LGPSGVPRDMRQLSARPQERVYRRHAGDVYRFALALLQDPREAEDVTRTVFACADRAFDRGERPRDLRGWVITAALRSCRVRARPDERERDAPDERTFCVEAVAVSRGTDRVLSRHEGAALRTHLGECLDCERWARSLHLQRRAFRALAGEPVPVSLVH